MPRRRTRRSPGRRRPFDQRECRPRPVPRLRASLRLPAAVRLRGRQRRYIREWLAASSRCRPRRRRGSTGTSTRTSPPACDPRSRPPRRRALPDPCVPCAYRNVCGRVERWYLRRYGEDGLQTVTEPLPTPVRSAAVDATDGRSPSRSCAQRSNAFEAVRLTIRSLLRHTPRWSGSSLPTTAPPTARSSGCGPSSMTLVPLDDVAGLRGRVGVDKSVTGGGSTGAALAGRGETQPSEWTPTSS